jgi:uncharacterized protein YebE (UPF0316 family)
MILTYVIFSVLNVIIQTIKSIATIKCNKYVASVVNAIAYGLYTYIIFITSDESLGLWFKIIVVAIANLIGVFVVKYFEEKNRKSKLWKIEATIPNLNIEPNNDDCIIELKDKNVSFNYIDIEKYIIINCYCNTQKESAVVKEILNKYKAKYFVTESKIL